MDMRSVKQFLDVSVFAEIFVTSGFYWLKNAISRRFIPELLRLSVFLSLYPCVPSFCRSSIEEESRFS